MHAQFCCRYAACRFHADHLARLVIIIADRLQHDQGYLHRRCRLNLAGRCLDEIRTSMHGQYARLANPIEGAQFARFEYHLEVRLSTGFFNSRNLIEYVAIITGEERTA